MKPLLIIGILLLTGLFNSSVFSMEMEIIEVAARIPSNKKTPTHARDTVGAEDTVRIEDNVGIENTAGDSLTLQGQLSVWTLYNHGKDLPLWLGGRYLPQLNYEVELPDNRLLDFEISLNINSSGGFDPFTDNYIDGAIKLYRGWMRWSGEQFELRLGLQKLNFGSASILRPLMWFDRIDPRDPLQFTDGVWGLLGRYYFLNNMNVWVWGLYGNEEPSVWEVVQTNRKIPEFGGRLQVPVPKGEMGLTYHHRTADSRQLGDLLEQHEWSKYDKIPEDRIGLDGKWDVLLGLWFEASWTQKAKNLDILTNQHLFNVGADYTFGLGNGLNVVLEHLVISQDVKPFEIDSPVNFSGASISYPFGLSDNLNAIVYYEWLSKSFYNFLSWKKQFNKITLYSMVYWNPEINRLPLARDSYNLMGGKGIQFMVVYNH